VETDNQINATPQNSNDLTRVYLVSAGGKSSANFKLRVLPQKILESLAPRMQRAGVVILAEDAGKNRLRKLIKGQIGATPINPKQEIRKDNYPAVLGHESNTPARSIKSTRGTAN